MVTQITLTSSKDNRGKRSNNQEKSHVTCRLVIYPQIYCCLTFPTFIAGNLVCLNFLQYKFEA